MKKSDLRKTYDEHVISKKILQVSYESVPLAACDVIPETLCQRLLLVKYFELK